MSSSIFISVIVPTCDRVEGLSLCLKSLAPGVQSLDSSLYEVIASDDGRTESSRNLIAKNFPWVKWVSGPRRGPASNRNNGARHAVGKWLAFIDDDCTADSEWLAGIYALAVSGKVDVVEGKTIVPDQVDSPFRVGIENLGGSLFWSCNIAISKHAFDITNGFDEQFLEPAFEDVEFAYRMQKHNLQMLFCPNAVVLHPCRDFPLRAHVKRQLQLRWWVLCLHKTSEQGKGILVVDSIKIIFSTFINQCRLTWQYIRGFNSLLWRTQVFQLIWTWIWCPFQMFYLAYWNYRWRQINGPRPYDKTS